MKLKVYSQTGKPTDPESAKAYEAEFKAKYDELWEARQSGKIGLDQMKVELDKVDRGLRSRFPMFMVEDMPRSGKQWKDLIIKYGCPVTLAITEEDHKLALFLMDAEY